MVLTNSTHAAGATPATYRRRPAAAAATSGGSVFRSHPPIPARLARGLLALAALLCLHSPAQAQLADRLQRPVEDEVIYFLMVDRFENGDPANDRGGLTGGREVTGFDPTDYRYFHGGDLRGVTQRLDYIAGLGATAIWVTPIFRNNPVQTFRDYTMAGYHGYWKTDFTDVDPHFGTRDDFRTLVEEAHRRGLRVILDIVINHTADIIQYRECHDPAVAGPQAQRGAYCPYRPVGEPPYTPFIAPGEETLKRPAWLNDPRYYHNRGESTFEGESSIKGDFAGLDAVDATNPRVVQGMIEIFEQWITDFRIDGYRIDTARHVETEFWQAFIPAILEHAHAIGIPHFYIFGEVYDPEVATLARFTRYDRFPAVLDFAFQDAAAGVAAGRMPPRALAEVFAQDSLYARGAQTAAILPTFLGNHDMGRIGWFLRRDRPGISDAEALRRSVLAHALMMFSRGVPTIYYGDEQGFAGEGGYGDARESMFPSRTEQYRAVDQIGTDRTPGDDNFDTSHPIYRAIAEMAALRGAEPALRRGAQRTLQADGEPGILAWLRGTAGAGGVVVVANTSAEPKRAGLDLGRRGQLRSLRGTCPARADRRGRVAFEVPALSVVVCRTGG
jgi:neopullulanase